MYAKAVILLFSIIGALMGATMRTIGSYTSASYSYATEDTAEVTVEKTNGGVVFRRNDGTTLFKLSNEPNEP